MNPIDPNDKAAIESALNEEYKEHPRDMAAARQAMEDKLKRAADLMAENFLQLGGRRQERAINEARWKFLPTTKITHQEKDKNGKLVTVVDRKALRVFHYRMERHFVEDAFPASKFLPSMRKPRVDRFGQFGWC